MPMSPLGSIQHLFTEYADYDLDEHGGFRLGRRKISWANPFKEVADSIERVQSPESLTMHLHKIEAVSVYSSGPRTRRSDSPGPVYTAIGTWTSQSFVFNPLTLTPQRIIPPDACLALVGQQIYPDSIKSDDLTDD